MGAAPQRSIRSAGMLARTGRASLFWAVVFFIVGQLLLSLCIHVAYPRLRDPEYGRRLQRLRQHRVAEPDRPLVLALGSSRMAVGLKLDTLNETGAGPRQPLLFNMSILGAGPVIDLFCLRRALADGICPDGLLLEIWQPLIFPANDKEVRLLDPVRLDRSDLAVVARYGANTAALRRAWLEARLMPSFAHRINLLSQFLPAWLPGSSRLDGGYRLLDRYGCLPVPRSVPRAECYKHGLERARKDFGPTVEHFAISDEADRALQEIIDLCRPRHTTVAFVLMPEASAMRDWYSARTCPDLKAHLAKRGRGDGVTIIDARDWMDDEEFQDGIHLHADGAVRFTQRFAEEVRPFLRTVGGGER